MLGGGADAHMLILLPNQLCVCSADSSIAEAAKTRLKLQKNTYRADFLGGGDATLSSRKRGPVLRM